MPGLTVVYHYPTALQSGVYHLPQSAPESCSTTTPPRSSLVSTTTLECTIESGVHNYPTALQSGVHNYPPRSSLQVSTTTPPHSSLVSTTTPNSPQVSDRMGKGRSVHLFSYALNKLKYNFPKSVRQEMSFLSTCRPNLVPWCHVSADEEHNYT
jgi:hypothetical protein